MMVPKKSYEETEEFRYFLELTKVPRPSGHLSRIRSYLKDFASNHNLEYLEDTGGNVVIRRHGGSGRTVVLQGHMDIVATCADGVTFDFVNQPLDTYVSDGWIHARGTTLGGDDGGGLALMLCALTEPSLSGLNIECLFTADEEIGLLGAMDLDGSMVAGRMLINIDGEGMDEITIGSAGSADVVATFSYPFEIGVGKGYSVSVGGLRGGHSAGEIDKPRINGILFIAGFLKSLEGVRIGRIEGGSASNVIPMRASASFTVPSDIDVNRLFEDYCSKHVDLVEEPGCTVSLKETECPSTWSAVDSGRFLNALCSCPNGVMDRDEYGVSTSSNLGVIEDSSKVVIKPRSSDYSTLLALIKKIREIMICAGAVAPEPVSFPAWKESRDGHLVTAAVDVYKRHFGKEPKVTVIHGGLESSTIKDKCPGMEAISIGPNIHGAHTPDECMELSSLTGMKEYLFELIHDLTGQ